MLCQSLWADPPTLVHAVVPVGVGSELLDGLTAQQARVGGLGPQGEGRTTDILAVALLAVLQTLVTQHNDILEDMNPRHTSYNRLKNPLVVFKSVSNRGH